ncbi:MAG: hypothetical protein PHP86_07765 [Nevskiales bacterium]|nr:hypothetical protein [Nevskiales bacterium]
MARLIVSMVLLLSTSGAYADELPWMQALPFESATIEFKQTAKASGGKRLLHDGVRVLYIADYGRMRAEYVDVVMYPLPGSSVSKREATITTQDHVYTIDYENGVVNQQDNFVKYYQREYARLSTAQKRVFVDNYLKARELREGAKGDIIRVEHLGHVCKQWVKNEFLECTLDKTDIALISANTRPDAWREVATSIQIGIVDQSRFNLPEGFEIKANAEADRIVERNIQRFVKNLLAGNISLAPTLPGGFR